MVVQSQTSEPAPTKLRAATPDIGTIDVTKETTLLREAATLITDILALNRNIKRMWQIQISLLLPQLEESSQLLYGMYHPGRCNCQILNHVDSQRCSFAQARATTRDG